TVYALTSASILCRVLTYSLVLVSLLFFPTRRSSDLFAVILKSVTLDGWVVIGILLIMAAISWVVMFDRASYLSRQAKANAQFMRSEEHTSELQSRFDLVCRLLLEKKKSEQRSISGDT